MAEYVSLIVRVDRSQVNDLQMQLNNISSKKLTFKIETIGDTKALQAAAKLESARAKIAVANAKAAASENALATQIEKTATAEEQARVANTKLSTQIEKTNTVKAQTELQNAKTATAEVNLANKQQAAANAAQRQAGAQREANNATKEASTLTKLLGNDLQTIIAKMAAWQIIGMMVATVIRSFREAVQTMREVDQELTNISKVSDRTAADLKRVGDSAYDTASKYGVAAEEYLKAVYTFEKAGLGGSAEQMAELATKTMLVGDTTADVASKFLVGINAAWDMGGAMDKLSIAVDQADYINNKYATSLDKLADGMPIVAATAANLNMSYEETIALLGTINSKTQETGRKTATAVRSFLIAISGQVGEFVDDVGETYEVTTENIEALTDALGKYGNKAVQSAIATGEIINPMEALNSLAQAYKDGLLSDIELQNILINVAGKMRYNQLVTIVKDLASETSTYREMLDGLGRAAGTADNEVSKMRESWNAKTQIIRNTWTEFLTHFINSGTFKAGIDALSALVKVLDTDFGRFIITTVALRAAFVALSHTGVGMFIKDLVALKTGVTTVVKSELAMQIATEGLAGTFKKLWVTMTASPLFPFIAAATAVYGAIKLIDAIVVTADEHAQNASKSLERFNEISSEISSINAKIEENNRLIEESDNVGNGNNAYVKRLQAENDLLQARIDLLDEAARKAQENAKKEAEAAWGANSYFIKTGTRTVKTSQTQSHETTDYRKGNIKEYTEQLLDMAEAGKDVDEQLADAFATLQSINAATDEYADEILILVERYNKLREQLRGAKADAEDADGGLSGLNGKLKTQKEIYGELQPKAQAYIDALNEMAEKGGMTDETMKALIAAAPELEKELRLTEKGWVANKDAIEAHLEAVVSEYETVFNNAASAAQTVLNTEAAKRLAIDETTGSIYEQITALARLYATFAEQRRTEIFAQYGEDAISRQIAANDPTVRAWDKLYWQASSAAVDYKTAESNLDRARGLIGALRRGGATTGGGSAKTTTAKETAQAEETRADQLARVVSLRKSELSVLEKSGASVYEQVAAMEAVKDALHAENEYLRSTDEYKEAIRQADEDASKLTKEQLDLLMRVKSNGAEWWDYTEKINKALEGSNKYLSEMKDTLAAIQKTSTAWVDEQEEAAVGPLQKQLDILKEEKETVDDAREAEEKRLAVTKSRIALENAQKERNIRQFNAATGRWEWVADAKAVADAQEALNTAKKELNNYYRDRAITELEREISDIKGAYSTLRDAIKNFATAIQDGTKNFSDALAYFTEAVGGTAAAGAVGKVASQFTSAGAASALETMKANGAAWGSASPEVKKWLEDTNYKIGTAQGWTRTNGAWYDQSGNRLYDSGGILRGIGGVKATRDDEMILPPKITASMLDAERNGSFDALLRHLGIVTAASQTIAGFGGAFTANRIWSQHNGDTYEIGGITLNEGQARSMTVYDLAQMARTLSLHNN